MAPEEGSRRPRGGPLEVGRGTLLTAYFAKAVQKESRDALGSTGLVIGLVGLVVVIVGHEVGLVEEIVVEEVVELVKGVVGLVKALVTGLAEG